MEIFLIVIISISISVIISTIISVEIISRVFKIIEEEMLKNYEDSLDYANKINVTTVSALDDFIKKISTLARNKNEN